jgi:hypothetical protein
MEMFRTAGAEVLAGLGAWSWLAPPTPLQPKFVSPFADVFFAAQDGAIWHLSPVFGELRRQWADSAELEAALATAEGQDTYLNSVWTQAAEQRGLVLEPSEAFHFAPPPAVSGSFAAENILVADISVVLRIAGQVHRGLGIEAE